MLKRSLSIILLSLLISCATQEGKEAKQLYDEASSTLETIDSFPEDDYSNRHLTYQKSLSKINQITSTYGQTELSKKILSNEILINNINLATLKTRSYKLKAGESIVGCALYLAEKNKYKDIEFYKKLALFHYTNGDFEKCINAIYLIAKDRDDKSDYVDYLNIEQDKLKNKVIYQLISEEISQKKYNNADKLYQMLRMVKRPYIMFSHYTPNQDLTALLKIALQYRKLNIINKYKKIIDDIHLQLKKYDGDNKDLNFVRNKYDDFTELAEVYFAYGYKLEAINFLDKYIYDKISTKEDDVLFKFEELHHTTLVRIAKLYAETDETKKAIKTISLALKNIKKETHTSRILKTRIGISEVLILIGDKNRAGRILDSCIEEIGNNDPWYIEEVIIIYGKITKKSLFSKVNNKINRYGYRGETKTKFLLSAAKGFYSINMPTQAESMISKIDQKYYSNYKLDISFYTFIKKLIQERQVDQAKNIIKKMPDSMNKEMKLEMLAVGYAKQGEFKKAYKIVEILSLASLPTSSMNALRIISSIHIENNNPDLALETMELIRPKYLYHFEDIKILHAISETFAAKNDKVPLKYIKSLMLEILHQKGISTVSQSFRKSNSMVESLRYINDIVKKESIELDSKDKKRLHEIVYKYKQPTKGGSGSNISGLSNEKI